MDQGKNSVRVGAAKYPWEFSSPSGSVVVTKCKPY